METGAVGGDAKAEKLKPSGRFAGDGACFNISGSVQVTGQTTNVQELRIGPGPTSSKTLTVNPGIRFEGARPTSLGAFKTAFEIDWSYNTDTGPDKVPTLDEASVGYLGFTAGYADSLMNFWDDSDFEFSASAPNRSSYLVSKEFVLSESWKFALGIEAGSPNARGATTWQLPNAPPYFTSRLRFSSEDWSFHASMAAHQVDTGGSVLLGGPTGSRWGWAATTGTTIPIKFIAPGDSMSAQFSYAVDSSIFLGTTTDVSSIAARFPATGPTKGYSGVTSYHHDWSEKWASNAFASFIALDLDLILSQPKVRTARYGVNLTYRPTDKWTIGVEVDALDMRIDFNGPLGILPVLNLRGQTAYLWVLWEF